MSIQLKPMLAVAAELDRLKYPLLASVKYDGIRAIMQDGQLLSRKLKPIPNNYVREVLEGSLPDGVDGELLVVGGTFNNCQSAFMRQTGEPNFEYHMFDYVTDSLTEPASARLMKLQDMVAALIIKHPFLANVLVVVEQKYITNETELMEFEEKCVAENFEGIMVRSIDGRYKCGRSTLNEGLLLKIKRWTQSEGIILSVEEQMRNDNEAEIDELGHTKRSSHQAGMTPAGTLGKFIVREIGTDITLGVGTGVGMTKELRQAIWNEKDKYIGKIVSFKSQTSGQKDAPRFPIWCGFRHTDDLGE